MQATIVCLKFFDRRSNAAHIMRVCRAYSNGTGEGKKFLNTYAKRHLCLHLYRALNHDQRGDSAGALWQIAPEAIIYMWLTTVNAVALEA